MNIKITSKELEATDAIKDYIEKKAERLVKYFGEEFEVYATIKTEGNNKVAEMSIKADTEDFRAVTAHRDLYASIDKDIDILEGQIRKTKAKREKMQKDASIKQMSFSGEEAKLVENEIVKVLHYDIRPISIEDAQMRLEENRTMLFLPFINVDTGKVNVIYKKENNNYGLVEPEA